MNLFKSFLFASLLSIASFSNGFAENAVENAVDIVASSHCHKGNRTGFKPFGESVSITITMGIPILVGPVPVGANLDITPYAIAPNGRVYRGTATNIVPATGFNAVLSPVEIPKPIEGNYVTGYFVTLGAGSPVFTAAINFSAFILANPVGNFTQSVTMSPQTLFMTYLTGPLDVMTTTVNFPIIKL